jgi:3-(3-hydroxy-phenyl)propionate hydroxylase
MGRVVCLQDPEAAAQRDAGMLAARASGAPALPPPPSMAFAAGCILAGSPGAGAMFPQPRAGGQGFDDVLGDTPWLLARTALGEPQTLPVLTLASPELHPFRGPLEAWFEAHGVEAVLIRPDRYIFGAGAPDALLAAWEKAVGTRA